MAFSQSLPYDFRLEGVWPQSKQILLSSRGAGWDRLDLLLHRTPAACIPEHYAAHHSICIVCDNRLDVQLTVDGRSQTIAAAPGMIGIYPASIWQTFEWHQEGSFLDLYLDPTLLTQAGLELCDREGIELVPVLASASAPLLYQIAISLKTALETDRSSSRLYADALGRALSAHLILRYSTRNPKIKKYSGGLSAQKLQRVVDYIDEHLERELSLAELAKLVELSSYHFARAFKQSTGFAPHQYHLQRRIERAKKLLLTRQSGIAEVSYAVGFASQAHLNYHFKRFVGVTPTAFLQQQ